MPLAEMSHMLTRLTLEEVNALLAEEEQRARDLERASQQPLPQEYIATLLRNAQAVKQISTPSVLPAPALPSSVQPGAPVSVHKIYEAPSRGYDALSSTSATTHWTRRELVPGVELHIRDGAEIQHLNLIEHICKIAGIPFQRTHKK
jgi:hypothetical protein